MAGVYVEKGGGELLAQRPTDSQREVRAEAGGTGHSPGTLRPWQLEKAGRMVLGGPGGSTALLMPLTSTCERMRVCCSERPRVW